MTVEELTLARACRPAGYLCVKIAGMIIIATRIVPSPDGRQWTIVEGYERHSLNIDVQSSAGVPIGAQQALPRAITDAVQRRTLVDPTPDIFKFHHSEKFTAL